MEATFDTAVTSAPTRSNRRAWAGRILSGLVVLFLTFDAVIKLMHIPAVAEASAKLGWPDQLSTGLALVLLACVALYAIPRTAVVGAVLLTGYLGGAVAIHLRVGDPLASHTLFPVYVGVMLWGGLFLRDARVRAAIGPSH